MYDESKVLAAASKYQDARTALYAAAVRRREADQALDEAQTAFDNALRAANEARDELVCAVNGDTPRHLLRAKAAESASADDITA